MVYTIKAHPTKYGGVLFRSRLEARWAAFFDLAGWKWEYEPIDLEGWTPDFRVTFPCSDSRCAGRHTLLVEVKPYFCIDEFKGHRCMDFAYGSSMDGEKKIPAEASAAFGNGPGVTEWEMSHGDGGGIFSVPEWVDNSDRLWKKAGEITQYKPGEKTPKKAKKQHKYILSCNGRNISTGCCYVNLGGADI